jgi:hypothetical protein
MKAWHLIAIAAIAFSASAFNVYLSDYVQQQRIKEAATQLQATLTQAKQREVNDYIDFMNKRLGIK